MSWREKQEFRSNDIAALRKGSFGPVLFGVCRHSHAQDFLWAPAVGRCQGCVHHANVRSGGDYGCTDPRAVHRAATSRHFFGCGRCFDQPGVGGRLSLSKAALRTEIAAVTVLLNGEPGMRGNCRCSCVLHAGDGACSDSTAVEAAESDPNLLLRALPG